MGVFPSELHIVNADLIKLKSKIPHIHRCVFTFILVFCSIHVFITYVIHALMCFTPAHNSEVHEIRNILFLFTVDAMVLILSDRYHFISVFSLYQSAHPPLSVSLDIISSKTTCDVHSV